MLRVPGVVEHRGCTVNLATGELECGERSAPKGDCRQVYCPHFVEMHLRRINRFRVALVRAQNKNVGR